ncbi:splicing factor 3A subunit 2 [Callorhinchus milii]|uniref:splicing factor 3A subunit 2 n=1 Tax=Callorhinchus milii TaxID=7868 RepID=UPI001C3FE92C|nr:splicing factor 3A subunit 2 [Callorhinchus milii]
MPKRKAGGVLWDHQPWKRFIPTFVEKSNRDIARAAGRPQPRPPARGLDTPNPGPGDSQPGVWRPPTRGLDTPNPGPGHRQPAAWRPLTRGLDTPNPGPGHRQPGAWTPPTRGLDTPNPGPGHRQPAAWRPPARGLDTPRSQPRPQPAAPAQNVELNDVPSAFNSFQFWRVPLPTINLDEIENPTLENAAEEMNCEETEEAAHVEMDVQN